MANISTVQAVILVGVIGGDGARVVLQRFARGGALTHSVAVSLDDMESLLPQAIDVLVGPSTAPLGLPSEALNGLDFSRGLLGQNQEPKVAAPVMHVDLGEEATQTHGPWQSASLWLGVGKPAFSEFQPEFRTALSGSWGGAAFLFDAQLNYAYSQQPKVASLNDLGVSLGARARWQVWHVQLGGGLFAGAELDMQSAHTAFSGVRIQLAPHAGAMLRADFEVAPQMFVGITGYGRVQAMRVQEVAGVKWQYPVQFGGLLGVGWLF